MVESENMAREKISLYKKYFNETFIKIFIVPKTNNDFGYTNR